MLITADALGHICIKH